MPQLDGPAYGTAAIEAAAAYFAALIAKASLGFCGVKWGGCWWGTGAIGDGHAVHRRRGLDGAGQGVDETRGGDGNAGEAGRQGDGVTW